LPQEYLNISRSAFQRDINDTDDFLPASF
jgi:hypothetical protein